MYLIPHLRKAASEGDELCLLAADEIEQLCMELQRIVDHYDTQTELYTNDADVARGMAAIARLALCNLK